MPDHRGMGLRQSVVWAISLSTAAVLHGAALLAGLLVEGRPAVAFTSKVSVSVVSGTPPASATSRALLRRPAPPPPPEASTSAMEPPRGSAMVLRARPPATIARREPRPRQLPPADRPPADTAAEQGAPAAPATAGSGAAPVSGPTFGAGYSSLADQGPELRVGQTPAVDPGAAGGASQREHAGAIGDGIGEDERGGSTRGAGGAGSSGSGGGAEGGVGRGGGSGGGSGAMSAGPRLLHEHREPYPATAYELGIEGMVELRALVGPDGRVRKVRVVSGPGFGLDEAARRAVIRSRFYPAVGAGGQPIDCWIKYRYRFTLQD